MKMDIGALVLKWRFVPHCSLPVHARCSEMRLILDPSFVEYAAKVLKEPISHGCCSLIERPMFSKDMTLLTRRCFKVMLFVGRLNR